MATYQIVPRSIPSHQRTTRITAIVATDRINIREILGRAARGLKITTGTTTDTIEFKLNNLVKMRKHMETTADITIEKWNSSPIYTTFSVTGSLEHTTETGLGIDSIEIISLTGPANIEIVVW